MRIYRTRYLHFEADLLYFRPRPDTEASGEFLDEDSLRNIPENHNLREVLNQVDDWGGRMTAASEMGSGTSIQLFLRKFY